MTEPTPTPSQPIPDAEREATPSSRWSATGQPDPHGTRYDCERAKLCMGKLTDDELANEMFLCDHRQSFASIGFLTAAKDRIRWLSRALTSSTTRAAHAEAALAAALAREARLRDALEPFAAFVANTDPVWDDRRRIATLNYDFDKLTVGIFRQAGAALASTSRPQDEQAGQGVAFDCACGWRGNYSDLIQRPDGMTCPDCRVSTGLVAMTCTSETQPAAEGE